ncbi:MAG: hypothetical protein FJX25_02370 [Alphaproteobacteria bacterium]|uniref:Uncharacterized protein n=1 Tax=Paracoccus angustae TaxID=1671480 RepID=A0ABV7U018_9RHOB|nr:hypothetical protein [Alphaproteobacteria bacterium]
MTAPALTDDRIRAVVLEQLERDPTAPRTLFIDFCAHALTDARATRQQLEDAAEAVADWLAREHVERGR